jgi:hypothetical protein
LNQFFHVPRVPDAAPDRNPLRHPSDIHVAFRLPSSRNPKYPSGGCLILRYLFARAAIDSEGTFLPQLRANHDS